MTRRPILKPSRTKHFPYSVDKAIVIIGEFEAKVCANERSCEAFFKVIQGEHGNLLSFKTSKQLDLFSTELFQNEKTSDSKISGLCDVKSDYQKLMADFKNVFSNKVGRLKGCKIRLHTDKSVKPVIQPYRRLPYHLVQATEKELDELIKNDIMEVPPGPVKWSQLVAVPKPKKPGEARITTDSRVANKAIKRKNFVTPSTEEIMYDLKGATVFSEIYFNKAFQQIELEDEKINNITTVETHRGPLRFQCLNMGVHNASEIFQNVIQQRVLRGLKGVRNIAINIIVFGKTRDERDINLVDLS